MRVLEGVVEPAHGAGVLVGVLRHGEIVRHDRLEDHVGRRHLDRVEDAARPAPRQQQRHQLLDVVRLRHRRERADEALRLRLRQRFVVGEQPGVAARGRRRVDGRPRQLLAQAVQLHLAGHLVLRVPARPHGHVEHARVEHVARLVPADGAAQLDRGAGAVGLVPGGVGAVVEKPPLHVDEAREDQLRQQLPAPLALLEEAEEDAVGAHHLAPLHQREPLVQTLLETALEAQRLLLLPVPFGRRRLHARLGPVGAAPVVAGHAPDELVPGIEPRGHVPERLRQRQVAQLGGQVARQAQAGARAQQAVVVVHEARHAAVEALVVGHVRVGGVRAHRLAQDFDRPAPRRQQVEERRARGQLVAPDDVLLQPRVEAVRLAVARGRGRGRHRQPPAAPCGSPDYRRIRMRRGVSPAPRRASSWPSP